MGSARLRNRGCMPYLGTEGRFSKPLVPAVEVKRVSWAQGLRPFERMHMHQTLASARRFAGFHPFSGFIPIDDLDFTLSSSYNHTFEYFPDPVDVYLQPETKGEFTWRRLRNTKETEEERQIAKELAIRGILSTQIKTRYKELNTDQKHANKARSDEEMFKDYRDKLKNRKPIPYKYNFAHPVLIGGIVEREHPSHIKLMNSSHHSPQTNAGYSRQTSDGTVFQY